MAKAALGAREAASFFAIALVPVLPLRRGNRASKAAARP